MSVTSNSMFLTVTPPPPFEATGWQVYVRDHTDYTTLVAVVTDIVELSIGPELNASGAGSVTVDLDSPFWATTLPGGQPATTLLDDHEYLWECWEDGILRFQFLGRTIEETLVDDTETHAVTISGPGAAEVLRFGVILRPDFPAPLPPGLKYDTAVTYVNAVSTLGWEFPPDWTVMRMWYTLFKAAQTRGTIPWVVPLFTAYTDSGGAPWEYVPTIQTAPGGSLPPNGFRPTTGQDLYDFLQDATGQDYSKYFAEHVEWVMWPGFQLDVRKVIGVHRESKVIFFEGGLQQKHRTRTRDKIANYVVVVDINGDESLAADHASIAAWNKREQWQDKNRNLVDPGRRNALSQVFLQQTKDELSQWVITVPADQPGRRPFRDYNIGDWIGIGSYRPGQPTTVDPYRVMAIVVHVADDVTVELTLQSKLEAYQRQLELQINEILNKVGAGNPDDAVTTTSGNSAGSATGGSDATTSDDPGGFTSGLGGGVQVFIQSNDPGDLAHTGDFWYDTTVSAATAVYTPDPPTEIVEHDEHEVHYVYPPQHGDALGPR